MHCFVDFCWFLKVYDVDVAVCGGDDEQLIFDIHAVYALLTIQRGDWGRLSQVPVLDCLVPGPGHEDGGSLAGDVDETGTADRLIMGGDLDGCCARGSEIKEAGGFVGTSADDLGAVL